MRRHRDHIVPMIHARALIENSGGHVGIEDDRPGNIEWKAGQRRMFEALSHRAQISLCFEPPVLLAGPFAIGSMPPILKLDDMQEVECGAVWRGERGDELSGWLKRHLPLR